MAARLKLILMLMAGLVVALAMPAIARAQNGTGSVLQNGSGAYAQSEVREKRRYRPRISVSPRHRYLPPHAKRACEAWLVKEYRVSGTVITPQMRCRWIY